MILSNRALFPRFFLGFSCLAVAVASLPSEAHAQNIFNWGGGDKNSESSDTGNNTPGIPNIFSGGQRAGHQDSQTKEETDTGQRGSDTGMFVRQPQTPPSAQQAHDNPLSRPVSNPVYSSDIEKLERMANAETTMQFLAEAGISTKEYLRQKAKFEEFKRNNPGTAAISPYASIDLMTEGKRYTNALAEKIRAACSAPAVQVMYDIPSFMHNPEMKENINAKVVQPFGAVISSVCSQPDLREDVAQGFYVLRLRHESGNTEGRLENSSGLFTLSTDFSNDEPVSIRSVRASLIKGIKENAARQQRLLEENQ